EPLRLAVPLPPGPAAGRGRSVDGSRGRVRGGAATQPVRRRGPAFADPLPPPHRARGPRPRRIGDIDPPEAAGRRRLAPLVRQPGALNRPQAGPIRVTFGPRNRSLG